MPPRRPIRIATGLTLVALLALLAVAGATATGPGAVDWSAWWAGRAPEAARIVVWEIRLPRVLAGLLLGAVLGVVGASYQTVLHNPLADPYLLGVSAGAALGIALAASMGFAPGGAAAAAMGFGSAGLAIASVWAVAAGGSRARSPAVVSLLLAGVAMSSLCAALIALLLFVTPDALAVRGTFFWMVGGLGGVTWSRLTVSAGLSLPVLAWFLVRARAHDVVALGDDSAAALGIQPGRLRLGALVAGTIATTAVVSLGGAVGFVGMLVPHAVRGWSGPRHATLFLGAALTGGALVVFVDVLARTAMAPRDLPLGALTGLLGCPFFLYQLARRSRGHA